MSSHDYETIIEDQGLLGKISLQFGFDVDNQFCAIHRAHAMRTTPTGKPVLFDLPPFLVLELNDEYQPDMLEVGRREYAERQPRPSYLMAAE